MATKKPRTTETPDAPPATTLYRYTAKGEQSVIYEEVAQVGSFRARLFVKRDSSYPRQSEARASVWSTSAQAWHEVATLHWSHIACRACHTSVGTPGPEAFQADRDELLRRFCLVVLP